MAQTTKRALAASFKQLLKDKPLDKITIKDICEDCEVNRQTFYYHFQDIYDMIDWIYTGEAIKAIDGKKTYNTWQQGYLHIFEYILENKAFVLPTYHSISREHLERYLYEETYQLLQDVIEEKAKDIPVRDKDKAFIANTYKFCFVGLVLEWLENGMKEDPHAIIERLSILLGGNLEEALEKFRTSHI